MIPLVGETMDRRRSVEDGVLEILVGRQFTLAVTHEISFSTRRLSFGYRGVEVILVRPFAARGRSRRREALRHPA
jgi:hypothetical protein